ncbi:MAG: imidazole glycerol phosphate synthase subunit HisH [Betaproteobacteria bacterium]
MSSNIDVAIVDYGLGNLYSVARACERAGLDVNITSDRDEICGARSVVLPGVGAFGDAMECLTKLDLVSPLRDIAASNTPLFGICLGLQLLMTESEEFGTHQGLGVIEGRVRHFGKPQTNGKILKVPQVGWNRVHRPRTDAWDDTVLNPIADGTYMYFVHSYYVEPVDANVVLSTTSYGDVTFCSAVKQDNVVAFQFHPERSGSDGMRVYQAIAKNIHEMNPSKEMRYVA